MTEEDALLAASKTDSAARMVYADWLDEHDRPIDAATQRVLAEPAEDRHRLNFADAHEQFGSIQRARFVRLQVEHATIDPNTLTSPSHSKNRDSRCPCRWCQIDRETLNIGLNSKEKWAPEKWVCKFAHYPRNYDTPTAYFARGFACRASCTPKEWFEWSDDLTAAHPIQHVWFTVPPVATAELINDGISYGIHGFNKTYRLSEVFDRLKQDGRITIPSWDRRVLREDEVELGVLTLAYPGVTFSWETLDEEAHVPCGETTVPASGWTVERRHREVLPDLLDYSYLPGMFKPAGVIEQLLLSLTYRPTAFSVPPRIGDTFGPVNGRGRGTTNGAGYRIHRAIVRNVTMTMNVNAPGLITVEAVSAGVVDHAV